MLNLLQGSRQFKGTMLTTTRIDSDRYLKEKVLFTVTKTFNLSITTDIASL